MVQTATETTRIEDVIGWEQDIRYSRESKVVLDGQTFLVGGIGYLNAADKAVEAVATANQVDTITFSAAMTAGQYAVTIYAPDGTPLSVAVAWDTNWATTMAAINVAITAAATAWAGEASVGAVMTGTATAQILTYSGVGFTLLETKLPVSDIDGTTGPTSSSVVRTTGAGADQGDMICLEDSSPSGADGAAVFLVRDAIVNESFLTVGTGSVTAGIKANLLAKGIVVRAVPVEISSE